MTDQAVEARRERLRQAVAKARSVNAVARQARIQESTLRAVLEGRTRELRIESYERLAPVLGVSVESLVFGFEQAPGAAPTIDPDLLTDCIVAVMELMLIQLPMPAAELARLAATAYQLSVDEEGAGAAGVRLAVKGMLAERRR
ncbi:MAG: hypothetical protein RLY86_115 [Pseudomonadota bacterium]